MKSPARITNSALVQLLFSALTASFTLCQPTLMLLHRLMPYSSLVLASKKLQISITCSAQREAIGAADGAGSKAGGLIWYEISPRKLKLFLLSISIKAQLGL